MMRRMLRSDRRAPRRFSISRAASWTFWSVMFSNSLASTGVTVRTSSSNASWMVCIAAGDTLLCNLSDMVCAFRLRKLEVPSQRSIACYGVKDPGTGTLGCFSSFERSARLLATSSKCAPCRLHCRVGRQTPLNGESALAMAGQSRRQACSSLCMGLWLLDKVELDEPVLCRNKGKLTIGKKTGARIPPA